MPHTRNIVTELDRQELANAYKFVLDDVDNSAVNYEPDGADREEDSNRLKDNWQDRMVQKYHEHLYKTHVIADLSQYRSNKIGLRWR